MVVTFKDFLVNNKTGGLIPDTPRLEQLSDEEFKRIYVEEMTQFIKNHRKNPTCSRCSIIIESPDNLVRYFGASLHNTCFEKEYNEERKNLVNYEMRYLDLVAKMKNLHVMGARK